MLCRALYEARIKMHVKSTRAATGQADNLISIQQRHQLTSQAQGEGIVAALGNAASKDECRLERVVGDRPLREGVGNRQGYKEGML